jgi:hypothetical protein
MKDYKLFLIGLFLAGVLVLTCCAPNIVPSGWQFLGKREVGFGVDRDVIPVNRSAGPLHRLLIIAKINPVEVWNIRVIFESGAVQDNDVRERLFVDRDKLVIDLAGDARRVREVIFRYRKINNTARRASVELYGI